MVVIRKQCDMMCNRRKHVCVGAAGFANQALTSDAGRIAEQRVCVQEREVNSGVNNFWMDVFYRCVSV